MAAATPMIWTQVAHGGQDVTMQPGQTYAVLASVSKNFTKAQVQSKAASEGFQVSYAWEEGDPKRTQDYNVDEWLAGLSPDPNTSHRWLYGEGTFNGSKPWTLGGSAPWPLTIYEVSDAFQAVPAGSAPNAFPGGKADPQPTLPAQGVPTWAWVAAAFGLALLVAHRR